MYATMMPSFSILNTYTHTYIYIYIYINILIEQQVSSAVVRARANLSIYHMLFIFNVLP